MRLAFLPVRAEWADLGKGARNEWGEQSSSGGKKKLLTGRCFSWGQTRMQRLIRSGWNFADPRISVMFSDCAGSITKMVNWVVLQHCWSLYLFHNTRPILLHTAPASSFLFSRFFSYAYIVESKQHGFGVPIHGRWVSDTYFVCICSLLFPPLHSLLAVMWYVNPIFITTFDE